MAKETILVVDDEEDILELISYNLGKEGYKVMTVASGEEARDTARTKLPDLIVLDLMLPGMDGLEVCRTLRTDAKTAHIPIIMLTAKSEDADVVAGIELGADDYVTKPFSPRVLLARIKAVLRRAAPDSASESDTIKIHDIVINPVRHEVLADGKSVRLTLTEFRILHFLARRPGWVFTRYQIVDGAQGDDVVVTDRSVDVHIVSLRKKLGKLGSQIETVRGVGYRLKDR
ncbi:MAG: response regulator [Phycisphaerae bacterium]|nr:response regulator [Phycisphaerae bacterium]